MVPTVLLTEDGWTIHDRASAHVLAATTFAIESQPSRGFVEALQTAACLFYSVHHRIEELGEIRGLKCQEMAATSPRALPSELVAQDVLVTSALRRRWSIIQLS